MMSVQPSVSDKQCACQFTVRRSEFFFFFCREVREWGVTVFAGKLFYCSSILKEKPSGVPAHIFNVA